MSFSSVKMDIPFRTSAPHGISAYLIATIRTDSIVPHVCDVRIYSDQQPTQVGTHYTYARIAERRAASYDEAFQILLAHVQDSPTLHWCAQFLLKQIEQLEPGTTLRARGVPR